METFFYKIKSFACKNAEKKIHGSRHQRSGKNHHEMNENSNDFKHFSPIISKHSVKSKPSSPVARNDSPAQGVSLSDIFTPDLADHHAHEELDTYINLF